MAPVGGVHYPRSYAELRSWFPGDGVCLDYLDWLRWPREWTCPVCGGGVGWTLSNGRRECADCGRQASTTAGTIFHRTRTPLTVWFAAAWQLTSQTQGISALGLQRVLGLGSCQTAWAMLHRFRVAMVRPGRERLSGRVEIDESYVGGNEEGATGRQTERKARVAIAVEFDEPKGIRHIRLQHVRDVSKASLIAFVEASVTPGSTVRTDGWQAYWTLPDHGYTHDRVVMRLATKCTLGIEAARIPPTSPAGLPQRVHLTYRQLLVAPGAERRRRPTPPGKRRNPSSLALPATERPWRHPA